MLIACRGVTVRWGTACTQHAAHIAHAAAAGPGPVAYVLLVRGSSQGLVDPAVRVCVFRHVVR